ncbi:MAG: glycosyltransferase [Pseudonocardia sp.]
MKRLSVVITNYNYERYVAAAIDSALALRWRDVEVVVVDDGSTDASRSIIERYGDRISAIFIENSTQRVAANAGFAASTGDVVIFLDSDDILPPDLPARLSAVWWPSVSKAQFRMQRIDANGRPIGRPFPDYRHVPSPAAIRRWATRTSAYPTPPGSGNAYARWFLERIFPVGPEVGDFADSACLAAAPFAGDVVSLPDVIVGYRQHGANDSDVLADTRRFSREVQRARARWSFARRMDHPTSPVDERPLFRSRELLQFRVAASRTSTVNRPLPGDGRLRMLWDSMLSPFHSGPEPISHRVVVAGWCIAMLVAPHRLTDRLLAARYGMAQ